MGPQLPTSTISCHLQPGVLDSGQGSTSASPNKGQTDHQLPTPMQRLGMPHADQNYREEVANRRPCVWISEVDLGAAGSRNKGREKVS